ncbi:MAG: hypothetical protein P8130_05100 [Deltaproteobacteria bacterium]
MVTGRAAYPGKPFLEIAAFQVGANNIADHAVQKAILFDKPLFVMNREIDKMPLQHIPQWGIMRLTRMINHNILGVFQCRGLHKRKRQHNPCQNELSS